MKRFNYLKIVSGLLMALSACSPKDSGGAAGLHIREDYPRLILSREDIRAMRANALSGQEPFASCYGQLQSGGDSAVAGKWSPCPYFGDDGMSFYRSGQRDGGMVRDLAILWQINRERRYADAAVSILGQWLSGPVLPGTLINEATESGEGGMLAARGIFPFLYGYDLLMADGLVPEQLRLQFRNWIQALVPVIKEGARRWKFNNYYDRQYFQNHPAAETVGLLAIAVILGDESLARYAMDSRENERDILDLVQGCILMEGDEPYYREPEGYPVHDGEIYDRYRHFSMGGHYKDYVTKPDRGLQYCTLTAILLVTAAEICRLNGFDLYGWSGEHGEQIPLVWKQYARFYARHDCTGSMYAGEEWFINLNNQASSAFWEIAVARFPQEAAFREVLDNNDRITHSDLHLFGPVVLTHGIR